MPFAVAAAGVTAAAGLASSYMQSQTAKRGQDQATAALQQGRDIATNQLSPWATTGAPANQQQSDLLGLNGQPAADAAMSTFQSSPGYQWQLGEGLRATDAGAAAKGFARSGAALQAEQQFGSGLAATDFGNYWNRLQQLSSGGLSAATGIANAGVGVGTNIASTDTGAANAQSSIYGNTAQGFGNTANTLFSDKNFQGWLSGSGSGQSGSVYSDPGATTQVNPATGLSYQSSTNPALNWI
jgi:hypothetical protein